MNMQRELACANTFNRDYLNGCFSDRNLWRIVTSNAASAAANSGSIGTLEPGKLADIAVFDGSVQSGFRAVIDARPQDVLLVMRGGKTVFGEKPVISKLGKGYCESVRVCEENRLLCLHQDTGIGFRELRLRNSDTYPLFYCGVPHNEPSCLPRRPASVNESSAYSGLRPDIDLDGDGLRDEIDNCPMIFNPIRPLDNRRQADVDGDGAGDECDSEPFTELMQ